MFMGYYRVTEILYPFSGMKYVKSDVLENAAVRGTKVHNACEGIARGLDPWPLDESLQGYMDSFMSWWGKGKNVLAVEQRFFSDTYGITGQVDLILNTPQGQILCDLKTSQQESKSWRLQGSAYSHMAKESGYDIKGILFLRLRRDGSFPKMHFYQEDMGMFKKCLDVFEYFFANKKQKKSRAEFK